MNINCQPPLQFVYFSTDTHIPWISHNTLRDRLFKNGVAIRKKVKATEFFHLVTFIIKSDFLIINTNCMVASWILFVAFI